MATDLAGSLIPSPGTRLRDTCVNCLVLYVHTSTLLLQIKNHYALARYQMYTESS